MEIYGEMVGFLVSHLHEYISLNVRLEMIFCCNWHHVTDVIDIALLIETGIFFM